MIGTQAIDSNKQHVLGTLLRQRRLIQSFEIFQLDAEIAHAGRREAIAIDYALRGIEIFLSDNAAPPEERLDRLAAFKARHCAHCHRYCYYTSGGKDPGSLLE